MQPRPRRTAVALATALISLVARAPSRARAAEGGASSPALAAEAPASITPGAPASPITYDQAIARARQAAPDLKVARALEAVARTSVGIAGVLPNPTVIGGTSTLGPRVSGTLSVPLIILGQRGAAIDASRAELATVRVEGEMAWLDVRAGAARAFVSLWLAERTAVARAEAAALVRRLEDSVRTRVEVGAAPQVEGLRVHAERLLADADAAETAARIVIAGSDLGRWLGLADGSRLRASGDPGVPSSPPPLHVLAERVPGGAPVRREEADARAADARASRERALVRPALTLDVGLDAYDPTTPGTSYRAQLGVEVPVFNQRGPYIEREVTSANVARARAEAERTRATADLLSAYRSFEAISARRLALEMGVVPAADAAAAATEESYALGHAALVAVLDANRARIDAHMSLLEASAARAQAWIDVERAVGQP
jgi:cobalt-zinc-cadmium efflux system outer membrane protein